MDERGQRRRQANPWFFQWLLGWEVTRWFRVSTEQTVVAAADGDLWLDLPQINFPVVGTTWSELERGPVTDRIFNLQMEFRWRNAPWRILPRDAGRAQVVEITLTLTGARGTQVTRKTRVRVGGAR